VALSTRMVELRGLTKERGRPFRPMNLRDFRRGVFVDENILNHEVEGSSLQLQNTLSASILVSSLAAVVRFGCR